MSKCMPNAPNDSMDEKSGQNDGRSDTMTALEVLFGSEDSNCDAVTLVKKGVLDDSRNAFRSKAQMK